jgi:uncharacterized protein YndB with AHSA1/START domain
MQPRPKKRRSERVIEEEQTDVQVAGVVREVRIQARPETVFRYLVDADRMIQWMGAQATLDARPGGELSVLVAGQHHALGQFIEIDPPHRVVFTFGWEGEAMSIPPGGSRVQIDLIPEDGGTRLRLVHSELPEAAYGDHAHGWEHYLGRLAALAESGRPARDPWDSVTPERDWLSAVGSASASA